LCTFLIITESCDIDKVRYPVWNAAIQAQQILGTVGISEKGVHIGKRNISVNLRPVASSLRGGLEVKLLAFQTLALDEMSGHFYALDDLLPEKKPTGTTGYVVGPSSYSGHAGKKNNLYIRDNKQPQLSH